MKRILSILFTGLLLVLLCSPAFAEDRQADVIARVERTVEAGIYPVPVDREPVKVTTDDNIRVTVENAPEDAAVLMVVPVPKTEKEAWKWIEDRMEDTADPVHTFEIYFEDGSGNRINADGAKVTIDCPHCSGEPLVCSLSYGGKVRILNDRAQGSKVTFTANGSAYYVMAQESDSDSSGSDRDESPKTADPILPWAALMTLTAPAILRLKRKQ